MKVTSHFCCAEVKDVAAQRSAIVTEKSHYITTAWLEKQQKNVVMRT